MTSLTVWRFSDPDKAAKALETLRGLQGQELIRVMDAAVISWPSDRQAPRVRQAMNLVGAGALGGTFWGALIGLIFLVPLLGAALGAAAGAIGGALSDIGIDDDFIANMREKVTPGTSALVMLSSTQAPDRIAEKLRPLDPELISTNLSAENEQRLRELFEEDEDWRPDGTTGFAAESATR